MENPNSCIRQFADKNQIDKCKQDIENNQNTFERLSKIYALAGNEVRLKIIYLLNQEGELCPCDLSDILQMSVPAISQHLRKLKDSSILNSRREGQTIFYSLEENQLSILLSLIEELRLINK